MTRRRLSRPRSRRLVALAAVLAAFAGAVEMHGGAAAHDAAAHQPTVFACDADHGRATHVEAARRVEPHDCAACLHRLHSRGGAPGTAPATALAAAGAAPPDTAPAAKPFPPLAQAPSRGPPLV
jgi:hypothetical protein